MSKFACICFTNENRLLQADGYAKARQKCKISFKPISKWDINGYNIFIPFTNEDLCKLKTQVQARIWHYIERELIKKDVKYVVFPGGIVENSFKNIQVVTGEAIRYLFADKIYRHIKREKWIDSTNKYLQVGIIAGEDSITEAVTMLLATETQYLYLFTADVTRFKKLTEYIYTETGLRVQQQYPVPINFSKPDLIFNLRTDNLYLKDIQKDKIYMDLLRSKGMDEIMIRPSFPKIGYDFYVKYGQEGASIPLLEAVLYSDDLSLRLIKKKIISTSFIIGKIYTTTAEVDNACYSAL